MTNRLILALAASLFLAPLALAEDAQEEQQWNRHQGFYVEGNGGANLFYFALFSTEMDAADSGFKGGGWSIAAGYNFKPSYAAEIGFMQNFAKFEDDDGDKVSSNTNVPYAAARFDVPIGDRFGFIAKVGFMVPSIASEDAENAAVMLPFVGVGGSYAITPNLDITLQYQGAVYLVVGAGLFSGGLTYHF